MADEHTHPDRADMRAALAVTRGILEGADGAAHEAAGSGSCEACTAMAGISWVISFASTLAGDTAFVSEPVRLALLDAVDASEAELRAAGN